MPADQMSSGSILRSKPLTRTRFLSALWAIIWKDLAIELRSRELLSAMFIFALLVIFIFNFALELDLKTRSTVTAGVLWATFIFAGSLGMNRSMGMEKDNGCIDSLLLAPVDRSVIYCGKALGNFLFMLIVEIIIIPIYSVLYNSSLFIPGLFLVILLGSLGYVVVGTLLSSMTIQTRTRDVLLPILLFPLSLPVVIAAVKASSGFLQATDLADIWPWLNLLIVYDIIFLAIAFMVYDLIVEE